MTTQERDIHPSKLEAAAPAMLAACKAVLEWARTPGNHGGNPYSHDFVNLADAAVSIVEARDE